ncbi:hypothetical protein HanPSC8_Chr15g0651871 [Helianthus annuus]|nr:hypothetical protein HanPSC8_Chr15g0651871 [Helianthus annuus]
MSRGFPPLKRKPRSCDANMKSFTSSLSFFLSFWQCGFPKYTYKSRERKRRERERNPRRNKQSSFLVKIKGKTKQIRTNSWVSSAF